MTRQTFSTGAHTDYGYDARNRLTSLVHKKSDNSTISSESYSYDAASNMTSKTVDSVTTSYGYDNIDQLTSESRTGYSASYVYDANGNRTSKTLNGVTESYSYDAADKMTAAGAKSYSYDAAGRTTSVTVGGNTTTLAYDYENRITTITYPDSSTNTFTYNGLDTRVGKVDSGGTKTFRRDGVGVTDPVLSDGAASYTPGISERRSGTSKFYHSDHLGSNTLVTNSSQATTDTKTYDAFGLLTASTGSTPTPFGFAGDHGYQEDSDSGLKLLGHRYYDPSTGRFLTRDPIKDGRNWYAYCENRSTNAIDASGLWPREWTLSQFFSLIRVHVTIIMITIIVYHGVRAWIRQYVEDLERKIERELRDEEVRTESVDDGNFLIDSPDNGAPGSGPPKPPGYQGPPTGSPPPPVYPVVPVQPPSLEYAPPSGGAASGEPSVD